MDIVRDGRFRWSAAIVLLLLAISLASGWRQHRTLSAEHDAAQRLARTQWVSQGPLRPHAAAHYGTWVFKPQMPLALLDRGITAHAGTAVFLQAHHQHDAQFRAAQDAPSVHRFADMTAAVVLQLILPLLVILACSSAIAGEREQGTLTQLMAQGVAPARLIAGKAYGVATALGLLLIPAVVIGSLAIVVSAGPSTPAIGAARPALLMVGYTAYLAAFIGLTLAVSAVAPTTRTALVALLGFWIVSVFVVPRAGADLARAVYPTPSRFEFQDLMYQAIRQGLDGHNPEGERGAALERRLLARYGVASLADLPVNFSGVALQAGEESDAEVWDRFYGGLWDQFERQNRLQQFGAFVAPTLAIRSLSMALAGTDFYHHRHFAVAAEHYRRRLVGTMNDDLMTHGRAGVGYDWNYAADPALWASVDEFRYDPPPLMQVLAHQWPAIAGLLLWTLVSGGLAVVAGRRVTPA